MSPPSGREFPRRPLLSVEKQVETNIETGRSQTRMFVKLYFEARDSGLLAEMPPELWHTLCCLATYMNEEGLCFPGQQRMARELGISRQQLNSRLKRLAAFRFQGRPVIRVWKERRRASGRWARNIYRVMPVTGLSIFGSNAVDGAAGGSSESVSSGDDTETMSPPPDAAGPDMNQSHCLNENTTCVRSNNVPTGALLQLFHTRLGRPNHKPSPREHTQARRLILAHGPERARLVVEHALQAATRTNFRMRSFGAVLRYVDEALAELAALESKKSRQHAERRREAEKLLHRNYLDWKRSEIARLRANLPAAEADELGRAARDRVIREHGGQPPVGFETLVRIVVEEAISRSNSLPDFDTWKMQGAPANTALARVAR